MKELRLAKILSEANHPERVGLLGGVVTSPGGLSMTDLRARLCQLRAVSEVPMAALQRHIAGLAKVGLVERTRNGRRSGNVQATDLGEVTYSFVQGEARIPEVWVASEGDRIDMAVPQDVIDRAVELGKRPRP